MSSIHIETRAKAIADARAIVDAAEKAGRPLTAEESARFDTLMTAADEARGAIDRAQALNSAEAELASWSEQRDTAAREARKSEPRIESASTSSSDEYRAALVRYLRVGVNGLMPSELRALNTGTGSEGGFATETVLDRMFISTLSQANVMRQLCTVISTSSDRTFAVESDAGSASWTAEASAYTESDSVLAQVSMDGWKAATIMKVSEELLADSVFDLGAYVATTFGRRIGALQEAAFVAGNNSSKPNGVFSAASTGVTAASASAITADELIDLYHSVAPQYRANAVFLANDSTIKLLRKLKDTTNQYLWQAGLAAGDPDRLLGRPIYAAVGAPAATTGLDAVCFFDPKSYIICDRGALQVQRLNELYAANGQVGFRGWHRCDGDLANSAAARVLTMA